MGEIAYVDSSVAAKLILSEPESETVVDQLNWMVGNGKTLVSSQLLKLELRRLAFRDGESLERADQISDMFDLVPIDTLILDRAGSIRVHIKTLDAIHIATALEIDDDDLVLISHDGRMREAAEKVGLAATGIT